MAEMRRYGPLGAERVAQRGSEKARSAQQQHRPVFAVRHHVRVPAGTAAKFRAIVRPVPL
jgi:hypothetical protein